MYSTTLLYIIIYIAFHIYIVLYYYNCLSITVILLLQFFMYSITFSYAKIYISICIYSRLLLILFNLSIPCYTFPHQVIFFYTLMQTTFPHILILINADICTKRVKSGGDIELRGMSAEGIARSGYHMRGAMRAMSGYCIRGGESNMCLSAFII